MSRQFTAEDFAEIQDYANGVEWGWVSVYPVSQQTPKPRINVIQACIIGAVACVPFWVGLTLFILWALS